MQASGRSSSLPPATMIALLGEQVAGAGVPNAAGAAFAKAETCLFDFLSCAFEARDLPWSKQALASAAIGDAKTSRLGEAIEKLAHGRGAAPLIEMCSPARS